MERQTSLSLMREKVKRCLMRKMRLLPTEKLVDVVRCVDEACDLFIGNDGGEVYSSSALLLVGPMPNCGQVR